MMSKEYELISGKPGKMCRITCEICKKTIMEMPTECIVKPSRMSIIDNSKCMLSQHEIKISVID